MSLQDDIFKSSEKSEKLSKLQNIIWGDLGSLEPAGFEAMQKSMKAKEDALEEYWDLCEADENISSLMQKYNLSREGLKDAYLDLIDVGAGKWIKGHFVALSALAYSEPFCYLFESEQREKSNENFEKVASDLIRYFREEIPQGELYKQYESGDSSFEQQEDLYPFCGYCGKKNQPSYKFCTKCGKPLDDNSEPNSKNVDSILDDLVQAQEDAIPQEKEVERNDNKPTWDRFRHLVEGHFKGKLNERETIATRDFWKNYEYIYYKLNADEMAIRIEPLSLLCKYPEYTTRDDQVKCGGLFFFIIGFGLMFLNQTLGFIGIFIGTIFILSIKSKKEIARKFSGKLILGLQGINSGKGMADLAANYIFGVVQLKGSNGSAHWPQYPSCALSGNKKLIPEDKEPTATEDSDAREKFGAELGNPSTIESVKISSFFKVAQGTIFLSVLLVLFICGIYLAYQGKGPLYPILKDSLGIELATKISANQIKQHGENGLGMLLVGAFWGFFSGLIGYWKIGENFSKSFMWGVIGSVYLATMYGLAGFSFSFAFGGGWLGGFLGAGLGWLVGYGAYQTKNKLERDAK
jgi:hypothetical protein